MWVDSELRYNTALAITGSAVTSLVRSVRKPSYITHKITIAKSIASYVINNHTVIQYCIAN